MAPMIEASKSVTEPVSAFYDALSGDYDAMTGFAERFVRERPFFRLLVERFGIRRAADAGSGTGFHALLLAELGVEVTAVDLSDGMVRKLRSHATERSLCLRAERGDIRELPRLLPAPVDAVFCMGNTLAHLAPSGELDGALAACVSSLVPGGLLLLQVVNFDRLLERRETIQSIRQRDGVTFIRFYEYDDSGIRFHILRVWNQEGVPRHRLESVRLHPLRHAVLVDALSGAGFGDIRAYGGIALEEFRSGESKDLVMTARRPA